MRVNTSPSTGQDTVSLAKQIHDYTSGYPFLVSRLCQLLDENVSARQGLAFAWSRASLDEAVKLLLSENNTLFQSLTKNLNNYPDLKAAIRSILMEGTKLAYNAQQEESVQMQMYGLIRKDHNTVRNANRIFETMLYNLFLSDEEAKNSAFTIAGDWRGKRMCSLTILALLPDICLVSPSIRGKRFWLSRCVSGKSRGYF